MEGPVVSLDTLAGVPLNLALDKTGVGLIACDELGRLTLVSPMLQEKLGFTFEPSGEDVHIAELAVFDPDGETLMPAAEMPLVRAQRGEFVRDVAVSARCHDGSLLHLRCNAVPLQGADGVQTGAIALVQDVTVETEAELAAERLRARVVETINHEFRTPLAALLGHVELIRDHRPDLDPELASWLQAIERAGWRLRDLVGEASLLVDKHHELRPQQEPVPAPEPAGRPPATRPVAAPTGRFGSGSEPVRRAQ